MIVELKVDGPSGDAVLQDLYDWLRDEPDLKGLVKRPAQPVRPGEMGSWLDVLTVAVASGGAVSVLATSFKAWLSQPRRSDVQIAVRAADGRSVEINASRVSDVERIIKDVLGTLGDWDTKR